MSRIKLPALIFTATLGVAVAAPSFGQSRAERNREAALEAQGSNNRIRYEELPPPVKDALDRERGDRRVLSVYRADRGDRSWYSVVVEARHGDRVIRVSPRGYVLGVADLDPDELRVYRDNPDRWYRDWSERQAERDKFYYRDLDRVTATPEHPELLDWDRVPARVRATILRENLGERPTVNRVGRYRQQDQVVYQINLVEGPNRQHMIKVLPDGSILEEGEFDGSGHFIPGNFHPKTVVEEDLPPRVRDTVDREAPRGRITHIDVVNRNGRDVYTVEIDSREETRYLTVSEGGKVLSDMSDRYR